MIKVWIKSLNKKKFRIKMVKKFDLDIVWIKVL